MIVEGIDILERIRKSEAKDDEVVKAVEKMKKAGVKMLRDKECREEDGLMLKEEKVYVPKDEALRVEIIRLHYDMPMEEHRGQWKMAEMCYAPSSISVYLGSRGHTCCPHVMLLFLVPVPGTFLLLSLSDIPLAIVPCNKVAPRCTPHGGLSPFSLVATPIPVPQLVYKLQ